MTEAANVNFDAAVKHQQEKPIVGAEQAELANGHLLSVANDQKGDARAQNSKNNEAVPRQSQVQQKQQNDKPDGQAKADGAAPKSLEELKSAKKQALQNQFNKFLAQADNVVDDDVLGVMAEVLSALRGYIDGAETAEEISHIGTLRNQIVGHASHLARHFKTERPGYQAPLHVLVNTINTGKFVRPNKGSTPQERCTAALREKFGFEDKHIERFLEDPNTTHRRAPGTLWQELEEIASAPGLVPTGRLSGMFNGPKYRTLQELLAARDQTRQALRAEGCRDQDITSAMWGLGVESLEILKNAASEPNCAQEVAGAAREAEEERASSNDPCSSILTMHFQFSNSKARRFLNDEKTQHHDNRPQLVAELIEIAATPGLVSTAPQSLFAPSKYQALQDALLARRQAQEILTGLHVPEDRINPLLRQFTNLDELKALDANKLAVAWSTENQDAPGHQVAQPVDKDQNVGPDKHAADKAGLNKAGSNKVDSNNEVDVDPGSRAKADGPDVEDEDDEDEIVDGLWGDYDGPTDGGGQTTASDEGVPQTATGTSPGTTRGRHTKK